MCDLSLVVPCKNEEESIPFFYKEASSVLDRLAESHNIKEAEFVFIDDGSDDKTLETIKSLAEKDPRVHYISFSRNFGKEAALYAGLSRAKGKFVATLDADLQDPPELLPQMFDAILKEGFDCAATRRATRAGEPIIRSFFARLFYKIMAKLCDIQVVDGSRDFRLMTRNYVDAVVSLYEKSRFSKGIFPWVGFKTKWFSYDNIERVAGKTKWSFYKLFLYSLDGVTAFSVKPLMLASVLGFLSVIVSFCLIIFIVVRKILCGDPVAGWPSMVCIILFLGGLQLFSIGILGQYLSKIYIETKNRPLFIVREEK
ncbi:MAG: glycosyltransferase family 2 protein [Spirochaetaceae bacterium]|nr:glycosyltransferase family 2 protein [Spirochaetaceae bacterium]